MDLHPTIMTSVKEIECCVTGRVQTVNYRAFAAKWARTLGIKGSVENREDFSVRVIAQGTEKSLEKFISYLRKGPFGSSVRDVSIKWRDVKEPFSDFSIQY